jgi:hypothetical protein
MGMVADKVTICTKSDSTMVCDKLRADGNHSVVLTIPDDCDSFMQSSIADRAAHTSGSMTVKRTTFQGKVLKFISSERTPEVPSMS